MTLGTHNLGSQAGTWFQMGQEGGGRLSGVGQTVKLMAGLLGEQAKAEIETEQFRKKAAIEAAYNPWKSIKDRINVFNAINPQQTTTTTTSELSPSEIKGANEVLATTDKDFYKSGQADYLGRTGGIFFGPWQIGGTPSYSLSPEAIASKKAAAKSLRAGSRTTIRTTTKSGISLPSEPVSINLDNVDGSDAISDSGGTYSASDMGEGYIGELDNGEQWMVKDGKWLRIK